MRTGGEVALRVSAPFVAVTRHANTAPTSRGPRRYRDDDVLPAAGRRRPRCSPDDVAVPAPGRERRNRVPGRVDGDLAALALGRRRDGDRRLPVRAGPGANGRLEVIVRPHALREDGERVAGLVEGDGRGRAAFCELRRLGEGGAGAPRGHLREGGRREADERISGGIDGHGRAVSGGDPQRSGPARGARRGAGEQEAHAEHGSRNNERLRLQSSPLDPPNVSHLCYETIRNR